MADIEDFLAGKPAAAPQGGSQIDAFLGDAAPSRTLAGTARDIGVTALKGAVGLPQAVVGLADIPTGGRVGKALEGAGLRFKDAQDALGEMYSPAQQAANRKVREAEGFVGTAQAMLQNPSTIATGIGESLPQMLGGAGVARGILAAAPRVGAVAAGALGEGVMGAGSAAEQIRGETADGLLTGKQAALAGASGAATAALGALGGKVAQRLGVGDVDTMLAQGSTRAVGQGSTRSMPRQIIEGGVAEGALEELPQSVAEQALQNVALERPWDEGVGSAAAQGLITGTAMGGAGGGVGASANRAQQRADAQALQRTQAAIDSAETLTQQAQDEQRTAAVQSAQDAAVARAGALADEEAAAPIADDGGAAAREQQVVAQQLREQAQAASRGEASPDDEIYQSTGAGVPVEPMPQGAVDDALDLRAPSEQMGINPAAGPLSRAAAQAVDTQAVQSGNATAFATTAEQGAYESGALAFQQGATRQELAAIPNVAARLQHLRGYDDAARQAAAATPAAPAASTTGDSLARQAQAIQTSPQQPQAGGQAPAGRAAAGEAQPVSAAAAPAGGGGLPAAGLTAAPASTDATGKQASWVIRDRSTGQAVLETFDRKKVEALNTAKYEAVPIGEHLAGLNRRPATTQTPEAAARPENWRTSMLRAGPVAQALGIDTRGKRLAQVVAEIDALDAGVRPAPSTPADPVKRARTGGDNARSRAWDANPMRAFLAKHGVSLDSRSEFAPGLREMRGAMVPGFGPIFRKSGKPLDTLAQAAVEEGFLAEADEAQLYQMIDAAVLRGERVDPQYTGDYAERQMRAELELRQQLERERAEDEQAAADAELAEYEAVMARQVASNPLFAGDDANILLDTPASNISTEQAMRLLGFTEEEINEQTRSNAAAEGAGRAPDAAADGPAARAAPAGDGRGHAPARATGQEADAFSLSAPSRGEVLARQQAQQEAEQSAARERQQQERRAQADSERDTFALTGSDRAADVLAAQGQRPMFSRSAGTRATYEARIDALFADGAKASTAGVRLLDSSDVMGLLGFDKVPLVLNETHVLHDGRTNHPEMTAAAWKKVPEWIENPAAVYTDPRHPGKLTIVAPVRLAGYPVVISVAPNTERGKPDHLLVTAFAKTTGDLPSLGGLATMGRLQYADTKKAPEVWSALGVNPRPLHQPSGAKRILTEKQLGGYRRANNPAFRADASGADASAMTPELAAALVKAAGPKSSDTRSAARRLSDERLVATQQLVDGLKEKWTNAPEIIVARNMQDSQIPQDVRDYDAKLKSQGSTGEAEGFIVDGKVFLLADKLRDPNHIATVLFHEVLGHYGLNRAFGKALTPILNQVALARRAEVQAKARSYGLDWNNREDRLIAAEEVLAEMAQTNPQLTLVQRAISAIRNWLRANVPGFKALRMSNQDIIQAFILPAREAVTRTNETMEQAVDRAVAGVRGETAFSRDTNDVMATDKGVAGDNSGRPASDTSEGPAGRSFDNAKGEYNPELDTFWLTQAARDIGDGMADATREEYFTAVAERANLHRVGEILEELGWKRRGSSNISMSTYYTKEIGGEGDPDSWDFEPYTYEVRVSDHDDYHPPSDEIKERVQVNFRAATDQWSDIDLGPDLSNAEIRERLLSVLPNEPTASDGSDAPRFSRSAAVTPAAADYTPEQTRAAERAFGSITKQTLAERAQSFRANVGTKLRQGIVDQFAPIKEVSAKAYMLARLSKGSDGAVEAALLYGKPFLRDGVYDVDMKDGGFAQVLAGLKGEHDRFFQWVAAQRAERLKAEGKENLLTDRDITALKSLNAGRFADGTLRMPAYAAALRDLNAFNEAALKVAMESGLIDQAAYELMKDQPYVPFYRLMEEGDMRGPRFSSGLVNQQAWKKLKGGSQQLNADLLQNTLMNWSHLYAAAARNRASLETMAAADKMGIAYQVPSDTKGAVKVMRDGVSEHWAVEDPYLLDAIMAMSYAPGGLVKAMAPFKRLLTFGVTVNPTFKIRNLIRDSLSAVSQSDLGYNPFANVASGWKATGRDSQTYASMLASGGIIKFGTQENTSRVRAQIERLGGQMLDKQGFDKFTGQMKALWEAYEEFGDRTENVNRAALYERLIAKGHSHAEASFMARDLMDFSMSGKWEAVRFLAQTVPFLNARLQGPYKLGRAAKEDPRRFAAMAGAVSMASLGLMAAYGDDDDWKKREDWDRDAYWWFKVGNTAFRIPKPFELGSIGTLAERTAELMMSDEMTTKRFGARISDMVFNTFAMDPTPQFIKPFIDVYANKDSFSGRAIEGMADERLRPQDRYNERTSEIARLLGSWGLPDPVRLAKGEYSGLSPKQIDFLLRGYFGWLATVITTATDMAARPVMDRGDRPAMRMRDTFLAGNFVEALPTGSSRYVTAMYEQARDVEQAWASYQAAVKSGDMDKAREIQEQEAPKLRNRLAIANAKRQIAELGQQAKRIEGNRLLSADQKREQLDAIEARKHQVAQRVAVTG